MPAGKNKKKSGKKAQNQWEDHYTRRARAENYPARSVFKLEEIQNKFKVIRKGDRVLDLGCSPGSWLLYASRQVGEKGAVFGIDLKKIEITLPENVTAVQGDILNLEDEQFFADRRFNTVLSDMAPATTGRKDVDALRSYELCRMALRVAENFSEKGAGFVCKIFQGNDFNSFQKDVKSVFNDCRIFKPESCRSQSREIYIVARQKK